MSKTGNLKGHLVGSWAVLWVIVGGGCQAAPTPPEVITRIAFGSCANQDRPQAIWEAIVEARPELFIFLGDNIYADTEDMDVMRAKYAKQAAVAGFAKLRAMTRILATWDDHDYGVNDGGADYPKRDESQKAFLEFFGEPKDSPRWKRPGVYESYVFGPAGRRVQVILLDTRYFRSKLIPMDPPEWKSGRCVPNRDPAATVLGEAQWKWLVEQLGVAAEVRIIGSSIQLVADDQPWEKWGNFPLEQERFYRLVRQTRAGGIVVISGDRHRAEICREDSALAYPLYDITSSGLNQDSKPDKQDEPNRRRIGHNYLHYNFGLITIDWKEEQAKLRAEIRSAKGEAVLSQEIALPMPRP